MGQFLYLAAEGYSDVIFAMNNQSEKPGYGYQLKMGATSLTEKWNAGVGSFCSQNHFMLGQFNGWLFHDLVGIGVDPEGAGFRKIIIKPSIAGDIQWIKGTYQSVSGLISCHWQRDDDRFTLDVAIPANTTATVHVPSTDSSVTEGGLPAIEARGFTCIKKTDNITVFAVASGTHRFSSIYCP